MDLRLWNQFQAKKERQQLQQAAARLRHQPTLVGQRQYLVDLLVFHLRAQLYRTKTVLAAELVTHAAQLGVPFSVVVFDGWFLHNDLIDSIEAAGKDWIGGCPKDRLVLVQGQWIQLQAYLATIPAAAYRPTQVHDQLYWTFTKVLTVKSLRSRRIRIVASFDKPDLKGQPRLLAANRKDWERTRILFTYGDRWPTETFNEDAKGHLGFEDYQLRKLCGIRRHWYLGLVAYSLLSDQGQPGHARQGVRAPFKSTGQRCHAVANETVLWISHFSLLVSPFPFPSVLAADLSARPETYIIGVVRHHKEVSYVRNKTQSIPHRAAPTRRRGGNPRPLSRNARVPPCADARIPLQHPSPDGRRQLPGL